MPKPAQEAYLVRSQVQRPDLAALPETEPINGVSTVPINRETVVFHQIGLRSRGFSMLSDSHQDPSPVNEVRY